jgi:hypothetical protein
MSKKEIETNKDHAGQDAPSGENDKGAETEALFTEGTNYDPYHQEDNSEKPEQEETPVRPTPAYVEKMGQAVTERSHAAGEVVQDAEMLKQHLLEEIEKHSENEADLREALETAQNALQKTVMQKQSLTNLYNSLVEGLGEKPARKTFRERLGFKKAPKP